MKNNHIEILIANYFTLIMSIILFFLDYDIVAYILIFLTLVFDIFHYVFDNIKIRYNLMTGRKTIIYAVIDNQNIMNLYFENKKTSEIIKKVYKIKCSQAKNSKKV